MTLLRRARRSALLRPSAALQAAVVVSVLTGLVRSSQTPVSIGPARNCHVEIARVVPHQGDVDMLNDTWLADLRDIVDGFLPVSWTPETLAYAALVTLLDTDHAVENQDYQVEYIYRVLADGRIVTECIEERSYTVVADGDLSAMQYVVVIRETVDLT
ncbi:MAG: hypothetical protein GY711_29965 [bacterium]|nr:hypothetical protein [bacterium]